ncbi:expressed unknown protein [Seminavis robusta]|uniref:Uncharacterized protein n=1 Tax=Seminavis robusta TaxID=568900 RepID=A0A9N8E9E2_9STRA|nr:expressed unknown protein [Seminavis robusta]|eukprot:Sro836_g209050.1 n/a (130) ;mRNA; f:36185-36574
MRSSLLWLVLFLVSGAHGACSGEFENCVVSRDCCGNHLSCETGNWAVTTDSTCLSERSVLLEALPREEKLDLLVQFYSNLHFEERRKSKEEVEKLFDKNSRSFAKLVSRIEKHYKMPVSTIERTGKEEL